MSGISGFSNGAEAERWPEDHSQSYSGQPFLDIAPLPLFTDPVHGNDSILKWLESLPPLALDPCIKFLPSLGVPKTDASQQDYSVSNWPEDLPPSLFDESVRSLSPSTQTPKINRLQQDHQESKQPMTLPKPQTRGRQKECLPTQPSVQEQQVYAIRLRSAKKSLNNTLILSLESIRLIPASSELPTLSLKISKTALSQITQFGAQVQLRQSDSGPTEILYIGGETYTLYSSSITKLKQTTQKLTEGFEGNGDATCRFEIPIKSREGFQLNITSHLKDGIRMRYPYQVPPLPKNTTLEVDLIVYRDQN